MPQELGILNEEILIDDLGNFPIVAYVEISDDQTTFEFGMTIFDTNRERSLEGRLCQFKVPFSIRNPIDAGYFLGMATKYGICVGWRLGQFTINKGIDDYKIWVEMYPESSIQERVRAMADKFRHDAGQFRDETRKTLINCLTLGLLPKRSPEEPKRLGRPTDADE